VLAGLRRVALAISAPQQRSWVGRRPLQAEMRSNRIHRQARTRLIIPVCASASLFPETIHEARPPRPSLENFRPHLMSRLRSIGQAPGR